MRHPAAHAAALLLLLPLAASAQKADDLRPREVFPAIRVARIPDIKDEREQVVRREATIFYASARRKTASTRTRINMILETVRVPVNEGGIAVEANTVAQVANDTPNYIVIALHPESLEPVYLRDGRDLVTKDMRLPRDEPARSQTIREIEKKLAELPNLVDRMNVYSIDLEQLRALQKSEKAPVELDYETHFNRPAPRIQMGPGVN